MVGEAFRLYPTGSLCAVILLTLYAIPFFVFVYRLDLFEREPVTMVAAAFSWGGLVATSLALSGNQAIFGLASKLGSPDFAGRWGPALAAPPTEETLKILGVVVLVLIARDQFDSPLDGMVYGALVGLGFQVVENFIYCINAIALAGGDREIGPVLGVFVAAGPRRAVEPRHLHRHRGVRHRLLRVAARPQRRATASAWWPLQLRRSPSPPTSCGTRPLLTEAFGEGVGILLGLVLKGIPVLVLLVTMYRLARRQEATWFRAAVAGEVGTDVLLREELDELMTLSSRKDVTKMVRRLRGRRAARLVGQLQHAQLDLGLACSRRGATGGAGRGGRPAHHPAAARRAGGAGSRAGGHAPGLERGSRRARRRRRGGSAAPADSAAGDPSGQAVGGPAPRAPRPTPAPDRARPAPRRSRSGSRPRPTARSPTGSARTSAARRSASSRANAALGRNVPRPMPSWRATMAPGCRRRWT